MVAIAKLSAKLTLDDEFSGKLRSAAEVAKKFAGDGMGKAAAAQNKLSAAALTTNLAVGNLTGGLRAVAAGGGPAGLAIAGVALAATAAAKAGLALAHTATDILIPAFARIDKNAKLADKLGVSFEAMQKLNLAASLTGESVEDLAKKFKAGQTDVIRSASAIDRFGLALSRTDAGKIEAANKSVKVLAAVLDGFVDKFAVELAPTVVAVADTILIKIEELQKAFAGVGVTWDDVSKSAMIAGATIAGGLEVLTGATLGWAAALKTVNAYQDMLMGKFSEAKAGFKEAMALGKEAGDHYVKAFGGGAAAEFFERAADAAGRATTATDAAGKATDEFKKKLDALKGPAAHERGSAGAISAIQNLMPLIDPILDKAGKRKPMAGLGGMGIAGRLEGPLGIRAGGADAPAMRAAGLLDPGVAVGGEGRRGAPSPLRGAERAMRGAGGPPVAPAHSGDRVANDLRGRISGLSITRDSYGDSNPKKTEELQARIAALMERLVRHVEKEPGLKPAKL